MTEICWQRISNASCAAKCFAEHDFAGAAVPQSTSIMAGMTTLEDEDAERLASDCLAK